MTTTGVYAHEQRYAEDADAIYKTKFDLCDQFGRFASMLIGEHWDKKRAFANDEATILTFVRNKKSQELRELARRITDKGYSEHPDFPNRDDARGRELCEHV